MGRFDVIGALLAILLDDPGLESMATTNFFGDDSLENDSLKKCGGKAMGVTKQSLSLGLSGRASGDARFGPFHVTLRPRRARPGRRSRIDTQTLYFS